MCFCRLSEWRDVLYIAEVRRGEGCQLGVWGKGGGVMLFTDTFPILQGFYTFYIFVT